MQEIPCDICGSTEYTVLFDRARNNEQVQNVICRRCGLVYINPRQEEDVVTAQYSDGSFSVAARGSVAPTPAKFSQSEFMALDRFRRLNNVVNLSMHPRGRALEFGCGVGSFLRLMHGAGWDVQGLEPDPAFAQAGEDQYGVPIVTHLYEDESWPDGSFDLIASFHVLEHATSPRALIAKAARELAPGGILYLEGPCIERPYDGNLAEFLWSAHLYTFSKGTLLGLLAQFGFSPLNVDYTGPFLSVISKKMSSDEVVVPPYPYDDPDTVLNEAHAAYKRFLANSALQAVQSSSPELSAPPPPGIPTRILLKIRNNPSDFFPAAARKVRNRLMRTMHVPSPSPKPLPPSEKYLAHYGIHATGLNAGDTMLFAAVRDLFDGVLGPSKWSLEPLHPEITGETIRRLNSEAKGIVIGGGGLFLRDTNANTNSGWQWNCPLPLLKQIESPLVVFAVGYNRFRGQDDFEPAFSEHIAELLNRGALFSLRNTGSVRQLSAYVGDDLAKRIRFQPCPTTIIRKIYPERFVTGGLALGDKRLAVNAAFDRRMLRFGNQEHEILSSVARAMQWAQSQGWEINLVVHCGNDAALIPWLVNAGVQFREINLVNSKPEDVLSFYREMSLTIGMRGHSQMIPFGCGNAILSLNSHDKMAYFLEDIEHPEWGVDVGDSKFAEQVVDYIEHFDERYSDIHQQIQESQQRLWEITQENLRMVAMALNGGL